MAILIRHDRFDERLNKLAHAQPARTNRTALLEAMVEAQLSRCERTGDVEAWRDRPAANGSARARRKSDRESVIPNSQPTHAPSNGVNKPASRRRSAKTR